MFAAGDGVPLRMQLRTLGKSYLWVDSTNTKWPPYLREAFIRLWGRGATSRLVICGKRGKERTACLANGALAALLDLLKLRGEEPGALFLAMNKADKIHGARMSSPAIYNMPDAGADIVTVRRS